MQVLTADGSYAHTPTPAARAGWPEAGTVLKTDYAASWSAIPLAPLASGEMRLAAYGDVYRSNPWVHAAVKLHARGLARLPLHLYELLQDGGRVRIRWDLPGVPGRPSAAASLDRALNRPSPGVSKRRLVTRSWTDRWVYGNALWTVDRVSGTIFNLWHVPWRRVVVHGGDREPIVSFEVKGVAGSNFYPPDEVVHFSASDDPDRPIGLSPLAPLRYTIRLLDAMQRSLGAFFANSARLSGNLKVDPRTSADNLDRIREQVRQLYTSPENAGKVLVSSADFQSMTATPDQQDIIELIRLSREEVLSEFHIPPPVAGILDKAIKSNIMELREQYYRDVIGDDADELESEIAAQLIPMVPALQGGNFFVEHEFGELLRPNLIARADAMAKLRGWWSTNELRRTDNLPSIDSPDANVPSVPLNERPLGMPASAYGGATQPGDEPEPPADVPMQGGDSPGQEDEFDLEDEETLVDELV